MQKSKKTVSMAEFNSRFAETLRYIMDKHGTTQKELADFVGVRPQTLSLYCTGETQPNCDKLLRIAEFFGVTTDYLLTGTIIEDIPVREMLGLSERTVENMKLVKDGYFEDSPYMLPMLDMMLGEKDFYSYLERAAYWLQNGNEDMEEKRDYYEFKALQELQAFFLDFLSRDFQKYKL